MRSQSGGCRTCMFGIREQTAASHICTHSVWFWKGGLAQRIADRNGTGCFTSQKRTQVEAVIAFGGAKRTCVFRFRRSSLAARSPACGLREMLSTKDLAPRQGSAQFVSETGLPRVFSCHDVSARSLLDSSCTTPTLAPTSQAFPPQSLRSFIRTINRSCGQYASHAPPRLQLRNSRRRGCSTDYRASGCELPGLPFSSWFPGRCMLATSIRL
ncbi:hypothetical protein OH76DRAFT_372686 [Lentinus brumalis]|uniref:Uncharacterized protein n=1 Tax=Lentinus brumalis TaxID=2498619 RepID=A0A371DEH3_9APHY|nr:hypothetical protein OH76DRAFT_372686 [Polyporus brumalis]